MNTKKLLTTLTLLALGVVVSVGLSYAAIWTSPTSGAPGGNIATPITTLVHNQDKPGGLSVNTFAVLGDGTLKQQAFLRGPVKGIDIGSTNPTLKIGGIANIGPVKVVTTTNGNWNSGATIGATNLINTDLKTLCSDDQGKIVLCPTTTPPPVEPTPGPLYVVNNFDLTPSGSINNITGSWYTLNAGSGGIFPIGPNNSREGVHGVVDSFTLTANIQGGGHVLVIKNGVQVACNSQINTGVRAFNLSGLTIAAEDEVTIELNPGPNCP